MKRLALVALIWALMGIGTAFATTWHCYYIGKDQWCHDDRGNTCHTYWIGDNSYTNCTGPDF